MGGLGGKVVLDGIFGGAGVIQGIPLRPGARRQILYVALTAIYGFTPSTMLEVAVRIPLMGKNFPSGSPIQVGIFHKGSLFDLIDGAAGGGGASGSVVGQGGRCVAGRGLGEGAEAFYRPRRDSSSGGDGSRGGGGGLVSPAVFKTVQPG